jgi:hypothetical protein
MLPIQICASGISKLNFPIPQHLMPFPLAANFANPPTLLISHWLGNRTRHDEPARSQSSPATDGSPPRRRPQEFFVPPPHIHSSHGAHPSHSVPPLRRPGLESGKLRNEPKAIPADLIQMQWVPAILTVFLPSKRTQISPDKACYEDSKHIEILDHEPRFFLYQPPAGGPALRLRLCPSASPRLGG